MSLKQDVLRIAFASFVIVFLVEVATNIGRINEIVTVCSSFTVPNIRIHSSSVKEIDQLVKNCNSIDQFSSRYQSVLNYNELSDPPGSYYLSEYCVDTYREENIFVPENMPHVYLDTEDEYSATPSRSRYFRRFGWYFTLEVITGKEDIIPFEKDTFKSTDDMCQLKCQSMVIQSSYKHPIDRIEYLEQRYGWDVVVRFVQLSIMLASNTIFVAICFYLCVVPIKSAYVAFNGPSSLDYWLYTHLAFDIIGLVISMIFFFGSVRRLYKTSTESNVCTIQTIVSYAVTSSLTPEVFWRSVLPDVIESPTVVFGFVPLRVLFHVAYAVRAASSRR